MNRHLKLGNQHDFSKYPIEPQGRLNHRKIPFSELVPAEFEDVLFIGKGGLQVGFYSPAHGFMESIDNGQLSDIKECKHWFRSCKLECDVVA